LVGQEGQNCQHRFSTITTDETKRRAQGGKGNDEPHRPACCTSGSRSDLRQQALRGLAASRGYEHRARRSQEWRTLAREAAKPRKKSAFISPCTHKGREEGRYYKAERALTSFFMSKSRRASSSRASSLVFASSKRALVLCFCFLNSDAATRPKEGKEKEGQTVCQERSVNTMR
jgi:hypothetical protein